VTAERPYDSTEQSRFNLEPSTAPQSFPTGRQIWQAHRFRVALVGILMRLWSPRPSRQHTMEQSHHHPLVVGLGRTENSVQSLGVGNVEFDNVSDFEDLLW